MSNGPTDFGSGYFFESQKGISDRRAAWGMSAHEDFGHGQSLGSGTSSGGGSSFAGAIIHGLFQLIVFLLPVFWEIAKVLLQGVGAILLWMISRRR